ncbi:MAG: amino acid adenylation domain-containing protein, partial [Kibdelosporangium sp.]
MTELFHEAVLRHAHHTPNAIAAEYQGNQLTYRELADSSAALAAALADRGVAAGTVVGVAARASLDLPVAILGIVRAGGAWLPLDPSYPADRLRYMVADSGIDEVVGGSDLGVDVIDPHQPRAEAPAVEFSLGALAYVIYTSGSTGRPKGVALTHGGLLNLAQAQVETFGVRPDARVLQFAPTSFDASVFELAMALYAGATAVLAPRDDIAPGPGLADFLRDKKITHLTLPPSVLATLPTSPLPDLAVLVCAGEALTQHLVDQWAPGRRMFNAYGPTETTVWATVREVFAGEGKPSIGAAIRGAHTLVVDETRRPVPAGVPGELAIGGPGVARGYLGRPALTAERFVPDPISPGARVYLTGDRVVLREDGELEFLGRVDHQVKIRGFRIEPDEIATRLGEHPDVADAVVVAHDSGAGPELVAYATGSNLKVTALREYLVGLLPAHLVPGVVMPLEAMPLTPSGKIDRAALPTPDRSADEYVEPSTPTEQALAAILADLLAVDRVSVHDDFFALGGHSLLAGRLAARVRSELGSELPLRELYQARTVAGMAALLDCATGATPVPPIHAGTHEIGAVAPLSFPQERIWFLETLAPGNLAYNAQATMRLRGKLDVAALRATLTEIVRRHQVFHAAFHAVDGQPAQTLLAPRPVRLPVVDAGSEEQAEQVVRAAMRDAFDLAEPPLARWILIRHAAEDHTLVHVEHHLVHDGWSFAVFVAELRALYPAIAAGQPSALPEPAVQYMDFALWQRNWMRGEVLDAYLGHWTTELAGCPPALELPTDRPRPQVQSFAGAAVRFDLPAELCRDLRSFSRTKGVTLFTTMLAGFATLLSRHSGQHDIVIGSGVANRRLAEIEQMMGMVVNSIPLRVDLSGEPGFDELAHRVHDVTGRAHEWQDVPLDRLVDALALPRDPARNPLFQVMFSFHDSQIPKLDFAGLEGTVLERHNGSAKTDLNIVVIPRAEQRVGHGAADDDAPITLIWEYATDLFDAEYISAFADHLEQLLRAVVTDAGQRIGDIDILPPQERK